MVYAQPFVWMAPNSNGAELCINFTYKKSETTSSYKVPVLHADISRKARTSIGKYDKFINSLYFLNFQLE